MFFCGKQSIDFCHSGWVEEQWDVCSFGFGRRGVRLPEVTCFPIKGSVFSHFTLLLSIRTVKLERPAAGILLNTVPSVGFTCPSLRIQSASYLCKSPPGQIPNFSKPTCPQWGLNIHRCLLPPANSLFLPQRDATTASCVFEWQPDVPPYYPTRPLWSRQIRGRFFGGDWRVFHQF